MAKKISKKTFTIFVVLGILVLAGFLFYSFNKKSNLFEGQTTNPNPPAAASINKHYPGSDFQCPRGFERLDASGMIICVMENWSNKKSLCNNNTYATQAEYDACINNS